MKTPNKPNQKSKTQLSRKERPEGGQESTKEIEKGILFDHADIKHSTRTVRLVNSCVPVFVELAEKYEDKDEDVDADQTRTVRPVGGQPTGSTTHLEEIDIDFRVPRLSHAVLKEAEHFHVQELVKKTESHLHREALQAELQQNNVHNPFSNNSKAMIRELGNVEFIRVVRDYTKSTMFSMPFSWNQGIVYYTCGQFSVDSES